MSRRLLHPARVLALTALLSLAAPAAAQDQGSASPQAAKPRGPSTLQQTLRPPEQPLVGQPIPMIVEVSHPAGTQVLPPESPADPRVAILTPRLSTQVGEQGQRTTVQLDWMVWRPGLTTLPSLEITVVDDAGQALALRTEPESLRVGGALEASAEPSLTGPLGPLRIFREDKRGLFVLVGSAVGGLLLLGIVAFISRKLRPELIPAAPKPAHQQALDALNALSADDLIARGKVLVYYERLSEIVRDYLGRRYGFPGTELTSSEILVRLADVRWPAGISTEEIRRWLQHTDMVKFAGDRPEADRAAEALRQAFSIVELTKPVAAIEPAPDAAPQLDHASTPEAQPSSEVDAPSTSEAQQAVEVDVASPSTAQQTSEVDGASTSTAQRADDVDQPSTSEAQSSSEVDGASTAEVQQASQVDAPSTPAHQQAEQAPPARVQHPLLAALLKAQEGEEP